MSVKLLITKITNPIFLTYELIIGNRRLIIPTMIGLIIALTVVSQSGVLIESYRQEIFEEVVFGSSNYYYDDDNSDVSIRMYSWNVGKSNGFSAFTDYENYNSRVNRSIAQVNYSDYVTRFYWYSRIETHTWLNLTEYDYYGDGMSTWNTPIFTSSSSEFFANLGKILSSTGKGRLPENSSEIILMRQTWEDEHYWRIERDNPFENVTLGSEVNITIWPWNEVRPNKTVKVVGVIDYVLGEGNYLDNSTTLLQNYLGRLHWEYSFLTQPIYMQQTIEEFLDYIDQDFDEYIDGEIRCKIFLDKTRFDAYNINNEISKLQSFIRALEWQFSSSSIYSNILGLMRQYESTIFGLLIVMVLLSFPVLCIALYLVVYSFGLIRKQKQEQIGIIKTRGGSWSQILVILLGEMLISTVMAVIIGFLLSTLLADVVMRSTNYLEFLGAQIPVHISIGMVQGLIFWGLILALLLNFRKIIRMSRQEITETLEPTETRNPVWKRYYLDILMFVIGTATWVILMTLIRASNEGVNIGGPGFFLIYIIITLLGIPAPFLMFFGTIMVIARFFPFIMKKLAELLWQVEGGINAFAIRNIVRHKQAANRAVLLITLALSFSILSSSLTFSLDETERLEHYYDVGADISVPTGPSLNSSVLRLLEQNISQLKSISGVYSVKYNSYDNFYRSLQFLFVDASTYAKTAFVDPRFKLSSSLSSLMDQLNDNETIILFEGNLEADISKPKIGDNISFRLKSELHSFHIGGTFKYWPTMYPYQWDDPAYNYWGIGSLGMFDRLNISDNIDEIQGSYQAKIDSQSNIEEIVGKIYNVTGISPNSPALSYKEYKQSFGRHFTLSILNSDLIISLVVSVIGVIMFAFFTYIERGKEIGVERALGMTQLQTAQSFLVEAAMILSFGSIIGYFTGVYFVTMFLQITQFGQSIPPMVVTYPTALLIQILLGIFITAGIGTIIPAYLATRKDISRILKVE